MKRRCPHCNRQIKITNSSWKCQNRFWCPYCITRLKKVRYVSGCCVGYTLDTI